MSEKILDIVQHVQHLLNQLQDEVKILYKMINDIKKPIITEKNTNHAQANKQHFTQLLEHISFLSNANCPVVAVKAQEMQKHLQALVI